MQNQDQNKLYKELKNFIPKSVISNKNRGRTWLYGYNEKYDVVVISKTGQIESVIEINGLKIALPKPPKDIYKRSNLLYDQYFAIDTNLNYLESILKKIKN